MKKVIAAMMALLLLAACGNGPAGVEEGAQVQDVSLESDRNFARKSLICRDGDTIYSVLYKSEGWFLYYLDKASGISGPLCGKPECRHNGEDCNAFLSDMAPPSGIACYDGRLWWVVQTSVGTRENARVYSESFDGTDRRTERELNDGLFLAPTNLCQFHRGTIYLTTDVSTMRDGEPKQLQRIVAWPLESNGEGTLILDEVSSDADNLITQAFGKWLYAIIGGYDQTEIRILRWDIEKRELETVFEGGAPFDSATTDMWVTEEGIYLPGIEDGAFGLEQYIYFFRFETGEFEKVFSVPREADRWGWSFSFADDKFILLAFGDNDTKITVKDLAGETVFERVLASEQWPEDQSFPDLAGVDRENLYYQKINNAATLFAVPLDGGEPTTVISGGSAEA